MFMDQAAILQAAATLAAAEHIVANAEEHSGSVKRKDPVERLLLVLASMADKRLISWEFLPKEVPGTSAEAGIGISTHSFILGDRVRYDLGSLTLGQPGPVPLAWVITSLTPDSNGQGNVLASLQSDDGRDQCGVNIRLLVPV